MNAQVKLTVTLKVYVHFNLFRHHQRIMVTKKELYFFNEESVEYMTRLINDEIEILQNDADLVDIWDRVEVVVNQCEFSILSTD